MIELYIENYQIILPDDFSLTIIEENPIITKAGDFSMDIDVTLLESNNAKALGFAGRLNNKITKKEFVSRLIIDNVAKDGIFVILSKTNISVKGQFLSGNSELNYFGSEKKIWDFDWGTEDIIYLDNAIKSMYYPGYGLHVTQDRGTFFSNYICPPVKAGDVILNNYQLLGQDDNYAINWDFFDVDWYIPLSENEYYTLASALLAIHTTFPTQKKPYKKIKFLVSDGDEKINQVGYIFESNNINDWQNTEKWKEVEPRIFIQPYLLYYVNKLPELLGYTLGVNELNSDDRAKIEYMINTVYSDKYADYLPDITVNEFMTYIETKFHVAIKLNSTKKIIDIVFLKNEIELRTKKTLNNVLDDFESIPNSENFESPLISDTYEYNSDSGDYFNYMKLSDDIFKKCELIEFDNFTDLYDYVKITPGLGDKKIIYRDLETNRDFFVRGYRDSLVPKIDFHIFPYRGAINGRSSGYDICLINKFKNIGNNSENIISVEISPAGILSDSITRTYVSSGSATRKSYYQLPFSPNNFYIPQTKGFIETIENNDNQFRNSKILVALYTGILKLYDAVRPTELYPFSHVDIYPEFNCQFSYPNDTWYSTIFSPNATKSLVLTDIFNDYAYKNLYTDDKFKFITPDKIDVSSIYYYEGAEYLPISVERKSDEKIFTGYFYRLK